MKEQADTSTHEETAADIAGSNERAFITGMLTGAAAGILVPAAAAAGIAATMGTDSGLGIVYWWWWATAEEVPVLTSLRVATIAGATIGALAWGPKRPRAAWWYGAAAGTSMPWLALMGIRAILELATGLAEEVRSFL